MQLVRNLEKNDDGVIFNELKFLTSWVHYSLLTEKNAVAMFRRITCRQLSISVCNRIIRESFLFKLFLVIEEKEMNKKLAREN